MKALQIVTALGPIDIRSVRRDPFLRWMIFYPLFLALLLRFALPVVTVRLLMRSQFDLAPLYPLLMSIVLLMAAMLSGTVNGFLLLDQKDDQTLMALAVTPLSLRRYLIYRVTVPMLLSVLVTLVAMPLTGFLTIGFVPLFLAALSVAPLAPFYGLCLAVLASNKVQGFAWTKAMGVLLVLPVVAYFVPIPWQWFVGIAPPYWPAKLFWMLTAGDAGWEYYFLIGLIYPLLLAGALLARFTRSQP